MRSVKSAFALLLTKVTKPAAERRKRVSINYRNLGGEAYKKNNQRYVLSGKLNDAPSGRLFRANLEFLQRCPSL